MKNLKSSIYLDAIIMFAIDIVVVISIGFILSVVMFYSADFLIKPWLKLENEYALEQVLFIIKILKFY